ncbi:hypothetical protein AMECASPLE_035478 [Ameca splendens]|uniref:Uncharacterized protein n=1 Tax=Ameca splendens TaxID=208324 RepID=A0ABV1AEM3_9TELE
MWFVSVHGVLTFIQYLPQKQESLFPCSGRKLTREVDKLRFLKFSFNIVYDFSQLAEVSSTTTNRELRYSIAAQLSLSSPEGYGLYMKATHKVGLGNVRDQLLFLILLT